MQRSSLRATALHVKTHLTWQQDCRSEENNRAINGLGVDDPLEFTEKIFAHQNGPHQFKSMTLIYMELLEFITMMEHVEYVIGFSHAIGFTNMSR